LSYYQVIAFSDGGNCLPVPNLRRHGTKWQLARERIFFHIPGVVDGGPLAASSAEPYGGGQGLKTSKLIFAPNPGARNV